MYTEAEQKANNEYFDKYDIKNITYTTYEDNEKPYPAAREYLQIGDIKIDRYVAEYVREYLNNRTLIKDLKSYLESNLKCYYLRIKENDPDKDYAELNEKINEMNESIFNYHFDFSASDALYYGTINIIEKFLSRERTQSYYKELDYNMGNTFVRKCLKKYYKSLYPTTKIINELIKDFEIEYDNRYSYISTFIKNKYNINDINLYKSDLDLNDYDENTAKNIQLAKEEIYKVENEIRNSPEMFFKYYIETCPKYIEIFINKKNLLIKKKNKFVIDGIELNKEQIESIYQYMIEKESD